MSSAKSGVSRGPARGSSNNLNAPRGPSNPFASRGGSFASNSFARAPTNTASPFAQANKQNWARGGQGRETKPKGTLPRQQQSMTPGSGIARTKGSWQDRWQAVQKSRERETMEARKQGLVADPENPRSLADAITPVGTCQEMCAEFERVQRVVQNDVWAEETDPNQSVYSSAHERIPDESRMVKKFRRAAAGLDEQLPSDLRPPAVLKRTCDFLFDDVVGTASSLGSVHHFVWDRTRAIRNDFSIQQVTKPEDLKMAVECFERIARFHIMSLHQLATDPTPYEAYDSQQEREQLDRTLLSLVQFYDDWSGRVDLPNEAEFRAYSVIHQLQGFTPDLEDRVQSWPAHIARDPRVQMAIKIYESACNTTDAQGPLNPRSNHLIARQDWERFWTLIASKQVSYLMACVSETYFNLIRRMLLNALWRGYRSNPRASDKIWTPEMLCDLFAFDDTDDVVKFCQAYEFSFGKTDDGEDYLDLMSVRDRELPAAPKMLRKQVKSELVEAKRLGRTFPAIINGLTVREARKQGLVNAEEAEADMDDTMEEDELQSASATTQAMGNNEATLGTSLFMPTAQSTKPSLFAPAAKVEETKKDSRTSAFGLPSTTGQSSASPFGNPSPFALPPKDGAASPFALAPSKSPFALPKSTESSMSPFFKPSTTPTTTGTQKEENALPAASPFSFGQPDQTRTEPAPSVFAASKELPKFTPSTFSFAKPPETKKDEPSPQSGNGLFVSPVQEPAAPKTSSFFNWQADPSNVTSETAKPASEAPATTQWNFEPASKAAEETPSNATANAKEQKSTQPTVPPAASLSSSGQQSSPATLNAQTNRKSSLSQEFQPNKPSPLRNSFSAETTPNGGATAGSISTKHSTTQPSSSSGLNVVTEPRSQAPPSPDSFKVLVGRIANEITYADKWGFLDQYIDFTVGQVITDVQENIYRERVNNQADEYRRRTLASRYGKRWREIAWRRRLAQQGRKRRERAQRRLRESKGLDDGASTAGSVRGSSRASSVRGNVVSREQEIDRLFQQTIRHSRNASMVASEKQSVSGGKRRHTPEDDEVWDTEGKRVKVGEEPSRNDVKSEVLKRSSFLGFSLPENARNFRSTTQTDYFRWKAMGIDPKGLARGTKRQRSESTSTPEKTGPVAKVSKPSPETAQPASIMAPPPPRARSKTNDEDEALFARLKAAREKLGESWATYESENGKSAVKEQDLGRSTGSQSSNESPSMIRARAEARLRASGGSGFGASTLAHDVPAYRMRESRFVPRESYAKAVERANEIRASRSRETSRAQSPVNLNGSTSAFEDRVIRRTVQSQESTTQQAPAVQPPVNNSYNSQPLSATSSFSGAPAASRPSVGASSFSGGPSFNNPSQTANVFGDQPFAKGLSQSTTFGQHSAQAPIFGLPGSGAMTQGNSWKSGFGEAPTDRVRATSTQEAFSAPPQVFNSYNSQPPSEAHSFTHGLPAIGSSNLASSKPFGGFTRTHVSESQPQASSFLSGIESAAYETAPSQPENHDFTIRPDQVVDSLRSSFGVKAQQETPSHRDSETPVISLMSDNEDDDGDTPQADAGTYLPDSYLYLQPGDVVGGDSEDDYAAVNGDSGDVGGDTEADSNVSEFTSQYPDPAAFAHNNPYAALADQQRDYEGDTEDDDLAHEPYINGYAGEDELDEEGESEDEEDYGDEDEDDIGDSEDDDEEGYDTQSLGGHMYSPQPAKSAALQNVGNTEEEAIELSD